MTKNDFLAELTEILEIDGELTTEAPLAGTDEYDSLAIMSLIAFIDEHFGLSFSGEKLGKVKTVKDLISLIGEENIN